MGNADWFDDHGFEEAAVSLEPAALARVAGQPGTAGLPVHGARDPRAQAQERLLRAEARRPSVPWRRAMRGSSSSRRTAARLASFSRSRSAATRPRRWCSCPARPCTSHCSRPSASTAGRSPTPGATRSRSRSGSVTRTSSRTPSRFVSSPRPPGRRSTSRRGSSRRTSPASSRSAAAASCPTATTPCRRWWRSCRRGGSRCTRATSSGTSSRATTRSWSSTRKGRRS